MTPETNDPVPVPAPSHTWFHRLSTVLFVIFCLELGLFLLVYPWMTAWNDNFLAWMVPAAFQKTWNEFWNNAYFRGAVSGLGIANIWIALTEIVRLVLRR